MSLVLNGNKNIGEVDWVTEKDFPAGQEMMEVPAVCYAIAAVGEVENKLFGNKQNRVYFGFDVKLPNGAIKNVWTSFTMSINAKSNLRKQLVRWRRREFSSDELAEFKLIDMLEAGATLDLVLRHSKAGKSFVNIDAIRPSTEVVIPHITPFVFDIDDPALTNFDKLPRYVQNIINETRGTTAQTTQAQIQPTQTQPQQENTDSALEELNEIPF